LIERGISADQVIAILPVEAQIMANPTLPQFRVLTGQCDRSVLRTPMVAGACNDLANR